MLKTVATNPRCLPSNVSRISYHLGSKRRLHSTNDVTRSTPDVEVGSQVTSMKRRGPFQKTGKGLKETRNAEERRFTNLLENISPHEQLDRRPSKAKFQNSLAAQQAVRPAVQSARVQEICATSGVEDAIAFVSTAPINTLNTVVWNTLIAMAIRIGRRKRAYDVYIEMKRRGFAPNARTFKTLLYGMADISVPAWAVNSQNLQRCHRLYEALELYVTTCKKSDLVAEAPYISHARASYVTILSKTGNHQKIVDIFYKSDESGPFVRDRYFYTALFNGLYLRRETEQVGNLNVAEQNASDAKFYWRTLEKDVERGLQIDSRLICSFIKVLSCGRPVDQQLGLSVVRDYFGLAPPGEVAPRPRFQLNTYTLRTVLELCNRAKKFRLCMYFLKQSADQVRLNPESTRELSFTSRVVNEQLIALGQLAAVGSFDESEKAVDAIRSLRQDDALEAEELGHRFKAKAEPLPAETVTLALRVCWRCGDWKRAAEIFSLATDCPKDDFLDDGPVASKGSTNERPIPTRSLNTSSFAHLARIALSKGDKATMRQCLRMIWANGVDAKENENHINFYKVELAKATIKLVEGVSGDWSKDEVKLWKGMKRYSHVILSKRIAVERPEQEEGLGSDKYIGKLQQAIDFDMYVRGNGDFL